MKKILVLLLVLVLTMSVIVGCSNNNNNEAAENEADVVTTASIVKDGEAVINGLSAEGTWIVATLNDITLSEDLVVAGEFMKDDEIYRKLGLYTQDEDRNVTARFTLTVPTMIVKSENFRVQSGEIKGDVHVMADGFELKNATVEGNVYFSHPRFMDTFVMDEASSISGVKEVKIDIIATASVVMDADAFVKGLAADGFWLVAALNDITLTEELVVDGEFIHREKIARKLALYTQDADRNVIDRFTLTAPKMTIKSENCKVQGGVFVGDVYVEANGFEVNNATIEGNIYFATQEYKDSFILDEEKGKVTGAMEVK